MQFPPSFHQVDDLRDVPFFAAVVLLLGAALVLKVTIHAIGFRSVLNPADVPDEYESGLEVCLGYVSTVGTDFG